MNSSLSPNTQAILLLTAPLIVGGAAASSELLTHGEYNRLARFLRDNHDHPADLLGPNASELIGKYSRVIDRPRLERLLGRGFLLSQAVDRWHVRAIWVVSRADSDYPRRLKVRLKEDAPPVFYGCGDAAILETGGLAVVGSRHVNDALLDYAEAVGRLAACARRTVISGGARGIDQAAMRGALQAGGSVVGVLADSLERAAVIRDYRDALMSRKLVLMSPYDPGAGFNVGHAMQRNKLIYALADTALVVQSDYQTGGTWTGAVEQLEKLRFVPVYVRSNGETGHGLKALRRMGALPWPNPKTPEAFVEAFPVQPGVDASRQNHLQFPTLLEDAGEANQAQEGQPPTESPDSWRAAAAATPAEELFAKIRELLSKMATPKTDAEVAAELQVSKAQAKDWLQRLAKEGVVEKLSKPTRYRSTTAGARLL